MIDFTILLVAGLVAGAMNAAAGGGSFVTFPAMVFAGVPSVEANASSTVALFPGAVASIYAYRNDFRPFEILSLPVMLAVTMVGGFVGALLLLVTPAKRFDMIVPWLLLAGTLVFAFGGRARVWLRRAVRIGPLTLLCCQFPLGIYCGYFGGAVGIMTLAVWSLLGMTDIRAMNATKTLVVGATNGIAVVCFILAGKIWWAQTVVMLGASIVGGYGGAHFAAAAAARAPPRGNLGFQFCAHGRLLLASGSIRLSATTGKRGRIRVVRPPLRDQSPPAERRRAGTPRRPAERRRPSDSESPACWAMSGALRTRSSPTRTQPLGSSGEIERIETPGKLICASETLMG